MLRSWQTSPQIAQATVPNIYKAATVLVMLVSDPLPDSLDDPIHLSTGPYLIHFKGVNWESEEERKFLIDFLRFVADDLERDAAEEELQG